jgi:hypothetical protein
MLNYGQDDLKISNEVIGIMMDNWRTFNSLFLKVSVLTTSKLTVGL